MKLSGTDSSGMSGDADQPKFKRMESERTSFDRNTHQINMSHGKTTEAQSRSVSQGQE